MTRRDTHTVAPQNEAAEVAVLGAMLQDPEACRKGIEYLCDTDFFKDALRQIFKAMCSLASDGQPIDRVSVYSRLLSLGMQDRVPSTLLLDLETAVPTAANVDYYIDQVRQWGRNREVRDAAVRLVDRLSSNGDHPEEYLRDFLEIAGQPSVLRPGPTSAPASLGQFVTRELPQTPDLIGGGVITQGGLCSLVGRAKLGKTWTVGQLGLTVAGLDTVFLSADLPVRQHGRVLFFNAEVAEHVFQYRLRLMLQDAERRGLKTGDARRQFFPVTVRGLLRLDRKAGEEGILKLADQVKPLLIILDPIGPLHGWDENSADEMGRLLNLMLGLCQKTGAAVLFTHHAPKSMEGREEIHYGRGSSVFGDRVDSALSLVPCGEQGGGSRLKLGFILRNGPPREPLVLWRGQGEFLYRAVAETQDIAQWLADLVTEEGEIELQAAKEKARAAGYTSEWRFRQALDGLEKARVLVRDKRGFPPKGVIKRAEI